MANSENTDLMSLGQHCAVAHCGQLDFLPFRCDCCEQIFCLEHRTYAAHQCPKAQTKETEVIICPLCASAIKFKSGEDANSAFEHHQRTGCDPQNYDRVHKKRKCPVANCKEKLTTVNTYQCKDCGTEICLKHRLPDDHNCQERKREGRLSSRILDMFPSTSRVLNAFPSTSKQKPVPPKASAVTKSVRREVCTQCGARFAEVRELINHVEAYHPSLDSANQCPTCKRHFSDVVQLVRHVESQACQKRACAIS